MMSWSFYAREVTRIFSKRFTITSLIAAFSYSAISLIKSPIILLRSKVLICCSSANFNWSADFYLSAYVYAWTWLSMPNLTLFRASTPWVAFCREKLSFKYSSRIMLSSAIDSDSSFEVLESISFAMLSSLMESELFEFSKLSSSITSSRIDSSASFCYLRYEFDTWPARPAILTFLSLADPVELVVWWGIVSSTIDYSFGTESEKSFEYTSSITESVLATVLPVPFFWLYRRFSFIKLFSCFKLFVFSREGMTPFRLAKIDIRLKGSLYSAVSLLESERKKF